LAGDRPEVIEKAQETTEPEEMTMADDTNQVADQPTALEAEEAGEEVMEASFDATAGGKPPESEKKPEAKPEDKKQEGEVKLGADGKPVEEQKLGADGKPIEQKPPELTGVQKNLAERAKKFEDAKPPEQKPPEQKPPETKPDEKKGEAAPMPADVEALLKIPGVADAKMKVDGADSTMGEFAKQYPEVVEAGLVIAKAIASVQAADAIKGAGLDKFVKAESIASLEQRIAQQDLLMTVMAEHPDCVKIAKTPEWKAWIEKQAPGVQKMEESMDPADAIALIDAFKEDSAKAASQKAKDEAKGKKDKKDALHKETLDGKQRPSGEGAQAGGDDEYEDSFNKTAGAKKD